VADALMMAVWRRGRPVALLHHSDQGSQYTSEHFQELLKEQGITCSMSRAGEVWDNSAMESFFSSLKRIQISTEHRASFCYINALSGGSYEPPHKAITRLVPSPSITAGQHPPRAPVPTVHWRWLDLAHQSPVRSCNLPTLAPGTSYSGYDPIPADSTPFVVVETYTRAPDMKWKFDTGVQRRLDAVPVATLRPLDSERFLCPKSTAA
jgi:hypothetical protein